jgi:hypothetical protein
VRSGMLAWKRLGSKKGQNPDHLIARGCLRSFLSNVYIAPCFEISNPPFPLYLLLAVDQLAYMIKSTVRALPSVLHQG